MFSKILITALAEAQNVVDYAEKEKIQKKEKEKERERRRRKKAKRLSEIRSQQVQTDSSESRTYNYIHSTMTDQEITAYELNNMVAAENDQNKVDKFWGLDKEANDKLREQCDMFQEEVHSISYERYLRRRALVSQWENEYLTSKESITSEMLSIESRLRRDYLRQLYICYSPADVINYKWPPLSQIDTSESFHEEYKNSWKTIDAFNLDKGLNFSLEFMESTIHLDGLQQSKTILTGDSSGDNDPASLIARNRSIKNITEASITQDFAKINKSIEGVLNYLEK